MQIPTNIKECQFCNESISINANLCKHCNRVQLSEAKIKKNINTIRDDNSGYFSLLIFAISIFLFYQFESFYISISCFFALLIILYSVSFFYGKSIRKKLSIFEIYQEAQKIEKRNNINSIIFLSIIGSILVFVFLTNPTKNDFKEYLKSEVKQEVSEQLFAKKNNPISGIFIDLINNSMPKELDNFIQRDNYYFFSVYKFNSGIENIETKQFIGVSFVFFNFK